MWLWPLYHYPLRRETRFWVSHFPGQASEACLSTFVRWCGEACSLTKPSVISFPDIARKDTTAAIKGEF